jgi:hypothetical protein
LLQLATGRAAELRGCTLEIMRRDVRNADTQASSAFFTQAGIGADRGTQGMGTKTTISLVNIANINIRSSMMRVIALTGLLLLAGGTLFADDPCAVLGLAGPYDDIGMNAGTCGNGLKVRVSNANLLARIINNQQAEIKALKDSIDALTKAMASLESTGKNLVATDPKPQRDTANSIIAPGDKSAGTPAAEQNLQDLLLGAIKEKLLKDPTFLEAVKKAP